MLAQNFKTAKDLRITAKQFDALTKVLGMLDRGEINEETFAMDKIWCGTAGCLCGWAQHVSDGKAFRKEPFFGEPCPPPRLDNLFMLNRSIQSIKAMNIRPDQAAMALRSFLTTGRANWKEALTESSNDLLSGRYSK